MGLVAEGEEVVTGIDKHDRDLTAAYGAAFRGAEDDVVKTIVAAGSEKEQLMTEIRLTLHTFVHQPEAVLAGFKHLESDVFARSFADRAYVRDDTVGVVADVRGKCKSPPYRPPLQAW